MLRFTRAAATLLLLLGAVLSAHYSGAWKDGGIAVTWVCLPMGLLVAAIGMAQRTWLVLVIAGVAVVAIAFGIHEYWEAFWKGKHGDVGGLALVAVPLTEGVLGWVAIGAACLDRWRSRGRSGIQG